MLSRLSEATYKRGVPKEIVDATKLFLAEWIPALPPGYRRGLDAMNQAGPSACMELQSQISEARATPVQDPADWEVASQMMRGLFNRNTVIHVLVPIGKTPIIPWFGNALAPSVSTMAVERLVVKSGYSEVPGGKGSHRKFVAPERPLIILPANRKSLSPGVLRNVASSLGYNSIRELAAVC
jgi:predicted RNA binding protein YcfA (HicA-like mRNA interferase family)